MAESRSKSRIGEANVERILDAALVVFSRYGLRGARTDQIAEAAGMSKPNLLYYFRTKEELYKTLGLDDPTLDEESLYRQLAENPSLLERPIVIKDGKARIGRPPEQVLEIL